MQTLKVVEGFGNKYWDCAIYIDDVFFKDGKFDRENYPIMYQLIVHLTNTHHIEIKDITAHICYRLSSYYYDFPKTWKDYENTILDYYENHQSFDSINEYYGDYIGTNEDSLKKVISQVFELNGGINFDTFYTTFNEHFPSLFDTPEWEKLTLLQAKQSIYQEGLSVKITEASKDLYKVWLERLQWVWDSPKDFEPYKLQWLSQKT